MPTPAPQRQIGIDTGGTFVDLVLCGPDGQLFSHKQLGDPDDRSGSVLAGISGLARQRGMSAEDLLRDTALIAHGTTLATNAVLTRTGARTALLTTEGLRDAIEMRRGVKEEVFDLHYQAPEPLVERHLRIPVEERVAPDGRVLKALSPGSALAALREAVEREPVEAVAISLMHSWLRPDHEKELREEVRRWRPDLDCLCSHEVLPQVGFFERTSTTVMTAYSAPIIRRYLAALERMLRERGFAGRLLIVTSSGGLMTPEDAVAQAARTVLSGPAAAPVFGAHLARSAGLRDAIVVDMGGTSFDVSLVAEGRPATALGGEIDRLKIAFPVMDVHTVPLGGGTIAWIDAGGVLQLGPESAGAAPGPACYDRGGDAPTITDADVVLGYVDPEQFRRSGLEIDPDRARAALAAKLGRATGDDPVAGAIGVFRLAATRMADAARRAALSAGLDYRRVPLIVGGGAGPIHASAIGVELDADVIIVPASAATLCATGALFLRPRYDAVASLFSPLDRLDPRTLAETCERLVATVSGVLPDAFGGMECTFAADLRYSGQERPIATAFSPEQLARDGIGALRGAFEAQHQERRGFRLDGEDVELLSVRAVAAWSLERPVPTLGAAGGPAGKTGDRRAYDSSRGAFRTHAVHRWESLAPGTRIEPPAVVELKGTTCIVNEPYRCVVDENRNLVLTALRSGQA